MRRALLAVAAAFLARAAWARPLPPSQPPEVVVHVSKKLALDAFAHAYERQGWALTRHSERELVFEKSRTSTALLLGPRFATAARVRLTLTFSGFDRAVRVRGRFEIVSDSSRPDQDLADLSPGGTGLQHSLEQVKAVLEGGVLGLFFDERLLVTGVLRGSPAQTAGILAGDRLTAIAGLPVLSYDEATSFLRGDPGTTVEVALRRDGRTSTYRLRRKAYAEVYGK